MVKILNEYNSDLKFRDWTWKGITSYLLFQLIQISEVFNFLVKPAIYMGAS